MAEIHKFMEVDKTKSIIIKLGVQLDEYLELN